jgi:hypothetical protein
VVLMATEVFANQASTTVASGGTDAPSAGTSEMWTVTSSASFPAASSSATPPTEFHVVDAAVATTSEIIAVTNVSGTTWTVTRGVEGTTPVAHLADFTIQQIVTAGFFTGVFTFAGGVLTGYIAPAVTTLTDASTVAINAALGNDFQLLMTTGVGATRAMGTPSNSLSGQSMSIDFQQPASGGPCAVTWSSAWDFGVSGSPVLSTTASAVDVIGFKYSALLSKWLCLGWKLGF